MKFLDKMIHLLKMCFEVWNVAVHTDHKNIIHNTKVNLNQFYSTHKYYHSLLRYTKIKYEKKLKHTGRNVSGQRDCTENKKFC